jgi:hypothetical protein
VQDDLGVGRRLEDRAVLLELFPEGLALTRLPLWAMATGPCAVVPVMGWALRRLELPAVE